MRSTWLVFGLILFGCSSVPQLPDTEQLAALANDIRGAYEQGSGLLDQAREAVSSARREADGGTCTAALAAARSARVASGGAMALAFLAKRACALLPEAEACGQVDEFADRALEETGAVSVVADSVDAACVSKPEPSVAPGGVEAAQ